jgi:hypothetical protein
VGVVGESDMEVIDAVLALAVAARFALLVWHGYRYGEVKSATPWSRYYQRETERIFYWMFMGVHTVAIAVCLWVVVHIALELSRTPR